MCFLFFVPLEIISLLMKLHRYRWRATLYAFYLWAAIDFFRATPAETQALGICVQIWSRLLRQARGKEELHFRTLIPMGLDKVSRGNPGQSGSSLTLACRRRRLSMRSFEWDRVNRGPGSQQLWHDKDPSLHKAMVTSLYEWNILEQLKHIVQ